MSTTVGSARRYYLGKRRLAAIEQNSALDALWRAKQEAEPGTALPADFPQRAVLETLGYTTDTDLDGADAYELTSLGFSSQQAQSILAAFEDLD